MTNKNFDEIVTMFLNEVPGETLKEFYGDFLIAFDGDIDKRVLSAMNLIDCIDEYVVSTLSVEEIAMNCCDYNQTIRHMEDHMRFIVDFSNIKIKACSNCDDAVLMDLKYFVGDWIDTHVDTEDRVMFNHIKRNCFSKYKGKFSGGLNVRRSDW